MLPAACLCACVLHARTFTSKRGDTLDGEIASVGGGVARILTQDKRTVQIPLKDFSDEDMIFIGDWAIEEACKRDGAVKVKVSEQKRDRERTAYAGGSAAWDAYTSVVKRWTGGYKITVENATQVTLSGLTVQYVIFVKFENPQFEGGRRVPPPTYYVGQESISLLKPKELHSFETEKFSLQNVTQTREDRRVDELRGVWLRIYRGEDLIHEEIPNIPETKEKKWPGALKPPSTGADAVKWDGIPDPRA